MKPSIKIKDNKKNFFFILKKDLDFYTNHYNPIIKTQFGFNFMKYYKLQLVFVLLVQGLSFYFSSDTTREALISAYGISLILLIISFILRKILVHIQLDEVKKEIDELIIEKKAYILTSLMFWATFFLWLSHYSSKNNQNLDVFFGVIIFTCFVNIMVELYHKYKSKKTKNLSQYEEPNLITGWKILSKIRHDHLQTDARVISFYSGFVDVLTTIFLFSFLYSILPDVEGDLLPDWLISQFQLFTSNGFRFVLLFNIYIRYSLFCLIEMSANPSIRYNLKYFRRYVHGKVALVIVGSGATAGLTTWGLWGEAKGTLTTRGGDLSKFGHYPDKFVQYAQNGELLVAHNDEPGREFAHICRYSNIAPDDPRFVHNESGWVLPRASMENFAKDGIRVIEDELGNKCFTNKPVYSVFNPNTWFAVDTLSEINKNKK